MTSKINPKVLIMSGYGINCESESAHAFEKAGAECEIVHINDLISKKKKMSDYQIIMFPGGFSYGDDTGSGNAFANKLKNHLWEDLKEFIAGKKLILGICNGFQIMTNLGLFDSVIGTRIHAMKHNDSNMYECRWINIKNNSTKCVFTKGINLSHITIAHGEGKFYCNNETYQKLLDNGQIVFQYSTNDGKLANLEYPLNPNGSMNDVAGICDTTGRVLGMMPHPERSLYSITEPDYQLKKELAKRSNKVIPEIIESNMMIFKNAVDYFKDQ